MRRRAMYQPEVYWVALLLMLVSMLCWGSWANSMTLCPGYRIQLLYWDFLIGLIGGAIMWGKTLGSLGTVGRSFYADIAHSATHPILLDIANWGRFHTRQPKFFAAIPIARVGSRWSTRLWIR